jgi:hypothetical protein
MRASIRGLLAFVVIGSVGSAPEQLASQSRPNTETLAAIQANLRGTWTGTLQYRDYQTNEIVTLPTWLKVTLTPDKRSLEFRYIYDDGPAKLVRETSRVTLNLDKNTFAVASEDGKEADVYQMSGADKLSLSGLGTLTMSGSGVEKDKRVEIRILIRLGRNDYHYVRETRRPGESFQMRDAYTFTRRNPAHGVGARPAGSVRWMFSRFC